MIRDRRGGPGFAMKGPVDNLHNRCVIPRALPAAVVRHASGEPHASDRSSDEVGLLFLRATRAPTESGQASVGRCP